MKQKVTKDYLKLLPVGLILLIVSAIVYMKVIDLNASVSKFWNGGKQYFDFFSYYKMHWFTSLTVISIFFLLYYLMTKKIRLSFPRIYIPLAVYITFVFLSASFSKYHNPSFFGFPDRFEGFFTIMCYICICFVTYLSIISEFDLKYIFIFLTVSVVIISAIGLSQFFGVDFLQSDFGKKLMLPAENESLAEALKFNFPEKYIYSTLYNPNYVGGFFGIVLPLLLVVFIASQKLTYKFLLGFICILSYSNLVGSLSYTGVLSAIVAILSLIIFLRKFLRKNIISLGMLLICFGLLTFAMDTYSNGMVSKQLHFPAISYTQVKSKLQAINRIKAERGSPVLLNLTFANANNGIDKNIKVVNTSTVPASTSKLSDIRIDNNVLYLYVSQSDALLVEYNNSEFNFYNLNHDLIDFTISQADNKKVINFSDDRFTNFILTISNTELTVQAPNSYFKMIITDEGFKFLTTTGQLTDIIFAEKFGFEGKETWASNRGYIWSRSIPLLKDTIFIGHGPDTYAMYFPQNDYVAKMKYLNNINIIVDKPHNMYLQIAINTGVISLLAFLVFVGWYGMTSIRLYFRGKTNEFFIPGVACFTGVVAFLVSSIANDSTISVSPLFWILIGAGIACNRLYLRTISK